MASSEPVGGLAPVDLSTFSIPQLEAAARGLGPALANRIRVSAQQAREGRTPTVAEADTYALLRSLAAAAEVLGAVAAAFTVGAAAAEAEAAEELVAVHGEQDGLPGGRIVAPDLDGTEIVVAPQFTAGARRWDWDILAETLVSVVRRDLSEGHGLNPAELIPYEEGVQEGARSMLRRLAEVGAVKDPAATKVDQLARAMAASGGDRLARALHAASLQGPRRYTGVKVTREEAKTRRRR